LGRFWGGFVLASAVVVMLGCTDLFAPMPGEPLLVQPFPQWRGWYARAEACSGLRGDFERVRWYRYATPLIDIGEDRGAAGVTWPRQHKIALGASIAALEEFSVEHILNHKPPGTTDEEIFIFAAQKGWILVTQDKAIRNANFDGGPI
jgi:hypothetical protein